MVAQPPNELKVVRPLIRRGLQLANVEPIITYYCYYLAVQTILEKGLHRSSNECTLYTTNLMDELEQRKEALKATSSRDLLDDDMVAQAYVEEFAMKVFNNGNRAIETRTATQKTADTLEAASVFLELLKLFSPQPNEEVTKKIRYCKYHAARILKAVREGADPNPPATPEEVSSVPPHPPAPAVQDVPDEGDIPSSIASPSAHVPSVPLDPGDAGDAPPATAFRPVPQDDKDLAQEIASDMAIPEAPYAPQPPPLHPALPQDSRMSEDYFPVVPQDAGQTGAQSPPLLPPTTTFAPTGVLPNTGFEHTAHSPSFPPAPPSIPSPSVPSFQPSGNLHHPSAPPSDYWPNPLPQPPPQAQLPPQDFYSQAPAPAPVSFHGSGAGGPKGPPAAQPQPRKQPSPEDVAKAQKFAKWAISALDYEDIDNAILQFRNGLAALGAA